MRASRPPFIDQPEDTRESRESPCHDQEKIGGMPLTLKLLRSGIEMIARP